MNYQLLTHKSSLGLSIGLDNQYRPFMEKQSRFMNVFNFKVNYNNIQVS